jgi:AraC-like DNA-binding protein
MRSVSPSRGCAVSIDALIMADLPGWWGSRYDETWLTQRPAKTPRQLVIQGGFVVDDGRIRRLERRAGDLGFGDLRSYLQTRCDTGHSVPGLAQELGVSEWTITQALATTGVVLPPRPRRLALQRRRHAEERIGARVVELGFAEVRAYLADRIVQREWLLDDVAAELGAHRETVRRLMEQAG